MNDAADGRRATGSVGERADLSRRTFLACGLGALAAPWLAGCERPPSGVSGNPRLTARPGSPTTVPAMGLSELSLDDGRDGLLYVPQSYSADTPAPLFVGLHGAGGAGEGWESYYARAEARGMILLAPDSRASTWDLVLGGFGPDVAFLDRALRHTFDRCRIDPVRIALAGFSDGASYALSLGISNGDLFSHLVAYSPGFLRSLDPVGRPPAFVSHGTQDDVLPVTTTRNVIVPTLRDAGHEVTYQEFDGGHAVPAAISEAALDWFLAA